MNFNKIFIIAEIGINHDGGFKKAKKLILEAKKNGADAVKFQLFKAEDLYLKKSTNYNILKKLELSDQQILSLRNFSRRKKIKFLCTPFSLRAADFLNSIKIDAFKIASMDNLNKLLIKKCASFKKDLFISTGMMNFKEINSLIKICKKNKKIIPLHCVSEYPLKKNDIGFEVIKYLKDEIGKRGFIGYSDHSIGLDACKIAILNGAKIIEKHFTLKKRNYLDHIHSMDPNELKELNEFRKLLNTQYNFKRFLNSRPDKKNIKNFRRGIYLKKNIKKNTVMKESLFNFVRPLNSSNYIDLSKFINKKTKYTLKKNTKFLY
jgi:N,N'-diacetyllegionaminate synthase